LPDQNSNVLEFWVREAGNVHPTHTVHASGEGEGFSMSCSCLASRHGALLCTHIAAVLREREDLVMYGMGEIEALRRRSRGSRVADPENGYWQQFTGL
jgi:hypothetical protein